MKYLKMFESFEEYYSEINYHDYSSPEDKESMSESDFLEIKYKIKSKGWKTYSFLDSNSKNTKNFKNVCRIIFDKEDGDFYKKLIITKMGDEWYYIHLKEDPWVDQDVNYKYYKADQLEGLEKFIDEVL
jgi:hypothetical protein